MVGKGLGIGLMFLLFIVIPMIEGASLNQFIEQTNNSSIVANRECAISTASCFAGTCIGGTCGVCPNDRNHCCLQSLGTCFTANNVSYGLCNPGCDWKHGSLNQFIEPTNNNLIVANRECAISTASCFAGTCIGGTCGVCPNDRNHCCLQSLGTCFTANNVSYGLCNPGCDWEYKTSIDSIKP